MAKASPKAMFFRVVHSSATPANTAATRFSSTVISPSPLISSRMKVLPLKGLEAGSGKMTRVSKTQAISRKITLKGKAKNIHCANEMGGASGKISSN